jgi:hypothetical protein
MAYGDHIYVWRHGFTLTHHGIDCGDGTVIDYPGDKKPIRQISKKEFAQGQTIYIVDYKKGTCLPSEEVVGRAMGAIGENEYDGVSNNCERFAIWCKTGEDRPGDQIENLAKQLGETVGGWLFGTD